MNASFNEISGIYLIRNIKTDECYVGSSMRLFSRLKDHMTDLANGSHINKILLDSWRKYGPPNFEFLCLEVVQDVDLLLKRELYWIKETKALTHGFNTKADFQKDRGMIHATSDIKQDLEDLQMGSMHQTLQQLIIFYKKHQQNASSDID